MGVYDDKTVTVRLALNVRDYIAGATAADAANRRLQASQAALGNQSKDTSSVLSEVAEGAKEGAKDAGAAVMGLGKGLAALGAGGGALKALPPALNAVGVGIGALPVLMGGAIVSAGVLKAGLAGIGDELTKVLGSQEDPFQKLTPNARNFLSEASRIRPALAGLNAELQSNVMQGTGADLNLLATKTLPAVQGQLTALASTWSHTFAEMALALSDDRITSAFNITIDGANNFFDGLNARIRPTALSLASIVTEARPVADSFGRGLLAMLDRFNAKIEEARQDGSLTKFFEAGADAAQDMAKIGGSVLDIATMIVTQAGKQGAAFNGAADGLAAYVASGHALEDVAHVVDMLTTAYNGLAETVAPIGDVLRDAVGPGTAQSIATVFQVLAAGSQAVSTLLQVLLTLNNMLGGIPLSLLAFGLALTKLRGLMAAATLAAEKGATALAAYGGAAARMGAGLPAMVGMVSKATIALFALDAAHSLIAGWKNDDVDTDKMAANFASMADGGKAAGEMTRDFGAGLKDFGMQLEMVNGANGGGLAGFIASANKAVPIAGDLAKMFVPMDFNGSKENFAALDKTMSDYIRRTGDTKGAQDALNTIMKTSKTNWSDLSGAVPQTSQALSDASIAASQLEAGTAGLAERQKLLNAPLRETITLGRSLSDVYAELNGDNVSFAKATIAAQQAVDDLNKGLAGSITTGKGKNKKTTNQGLALTGDKTDFNTDIQRGRDQLNLLLQTADAAQKAAQAKLDDNGTVEEAAGVYDAYINRLRASLAAHGAGKATIESLIGTYAKMPAALEGAAGAVNDLSGNLSKIPKGTKFMFDGTSLIDGKGKTLALAGDISKIPAGKTFTWNGKSVVDGKGKVYALTGAIKAVPPTKRINMISTSVDGAKTKVGNLANDLRGLPDGLAHINVNNGSALNAIRQVRQSLANLGGTSVGISNRAGGVYTRAAAEGLLQPVIAPPGTRYQWAEPETGGEAFIPKNGDRSRGRAILGQAAEWYGMRTVPMRAGGITVAAASGLVNVAPSTTAAATTTRATPFDYAKSYLQTRDAVASLNDALKKNKNAFSTATAKGRENRSALYGVIDAAQSAAQTKYNETGSVKLANAAYSTYLARLKATLAQHKVNATTIRSLLALAQRPVYDTTAKITKAPTNSASNIAFEQAAIGAAGGLADLKDKLSLNRPGLTLATAEGRENLTTILGYFQSAASAAQARFDQTHNAKTATTLYGSYLSQLKHALSSAGYSAAAINALVSQYGRITLTPTPNARGGAYMAAGGVATLGRAQLFPSTGSPLYGFAEPGTGGELFVPRHGDQQRGRDLLAVGAGWYGGRFVTGGGGAGGGAAYDYSTHMTVHAMSYNPTSAELLTHQRTVDAQARVGRRY